MVKKFPSKEDTYCQICGEYLGMIQNSCNVLDTIPELCEIHTDHKCSITRLTAIEKKEKNIKRGRRAVEDHPESYYGTPFAYVDQLNIGVFILSLNNL